MKKKYSEAEKASLLHHFGASGLSRAEWCRKHDIPYHTMISWERQQQPRGFARISPVVTEKSGFDVEVRLPNQVVLRISQVKDLDVLMMALRKL